MTVVARRRFLALAAAHIGCVQTDRRVLMNSIAARYIKLVLAVGAHDPDYVDAYYGPAEWKDEAQRRKWPLAEIAHEARDVLAALDNLPPGGGELDRLRHRYLTVQTRSLIARAGMLEGQRLSFDEESRALYDAVAPHRPLSHFDETLARLEKLVPGTAPLAERYAEWQKRFAIPAAKLPEVFRAAIGEARGRTRKHISLPRKESFTVEYVSGQVWSAYNWYKGNAHSLIQVNTDLPVSMNFLLRLACHEGYPGHHVYNTLLEDRLVRGHGWLEYSVYPLYSPQSLIAEGSADYGLELAFPPADRADYLEKALFPLADLDASQARLYVEASQIADELDHATNMAARRYVDGEIGRAECQRLLEKYVLMAPDRAAQRVRFIDKNRAYVINYNAGEDLIRQYMAKRGAGAEAWRVFEELLSSPRLPSGLG